ncbi:MAG: hypothetical protein ACK4I8_07000, partial [Armatimonadota bacterium]
MKRLLDRIAHLQPIVSTVQASDLRDRPEIVRNNYEFVAALFYPFESIKRELREPLLRRLRDGKPIFGYVSGDYGYGKTATMVWLWHQCEREEIVAVPPFLFYDWDAFINATAHWLGFRLKERRPDLVEKVEQLLNRFHSEAIDTLAESYARQERIPVDRARHIIEDLLKRGMLSLANPSQVVSFLREATELAKEGGYKGLTVFADEVQNFVDRENIHEQIEQLRKFVHAFRTLDCPAGVFWGLASRVEERLNEQAGDMIQRIQDYSAFLHLQGAYTREFPAQLWKHLCDTYAPEAFDLIDGAALEALGQICERKDLSNGPRTVIAALRSAAARWQEKRQRYTVWELADDYEHRHIVFEGVEQMITTTLRTLLNEPLVRSNPEYQKAIRFLCMFPAGVHIKVMERYGVDKAVKELAETWSFLGTYIYQPQHDCFALTQLKPEQVKVDPLTELLRRFRDRWWHEYSEETKLRTSKVAFIAFVLPEIFPKRGSGEQGKWSGHSKSLEEVAESATRRVAELVLEGSFDGTMMQFPERRVAIAVSNDEQALSRWHASDDDIDLTFRFLLRSQIAEDAPSEVITTQGEPVLDFRLNMERHYDDYPSDLQIFRDIMLPQSVTAMVLLNLAMFVYAEMSRRALPESDRQLLETNLLKPAIRHAIQLLFHETMRGVGVSPRGIGQTLVEQIFSQKCKELFPDYSPLLTTRQSINDLNRYKTMLLQSKLTRAEKQGRRAVSWTNEELTRNLGVSASQRDAIVNRLNGMGLLKVREVSMKEGRKLQVTFAQHPLEQKLREWVEEFGKKVTVTVGGRKREVKEIAISELRQRARRWGAYDEEIEVAMDLAQARGILERTNDKVRQTVFIEDPEAIRQDAEKLRESLEPLSPHFREDVRRFGEQLDKIVALTYADDEGQHEEARHSLGDLYASLKEFALQKADQIARDAHELERKARERLTRLPLKDVERKVELSLRLAEWLDDQRRQLQKKLQRVSDELQKTVNEAGRVAQQTEIVRRTEETRERLERLRTVAEQMQKLRKQVSDVLQQTEALGAYVDGFVQWKALAEEADNFRGDLPDRYADLRQRFDEWQESVMEHFAEQQQEALKEHERFRLDLDELRRELAKRQQGERDAFAKLKEAYEKQFFAITEHRLSTTYDPADPEGSYERLFNEVMERFSSAFDKLNELIQH